MNDKINEEFIDRLIGNKILTLRKSRDLSQQDLSEKLGIVRQSLQKYEAGESKIPVSMLYQLSVLLNVDVRYFIDSTQHSNKLFDNKFDNIIPSRRINPLKILIAEDKVTDGLMTKKAIDRCGYEVEVFNASDGVEALKMLRSRDINGDNLRPDLIFLDLNMPKKPGRLVLKEIKSDKTLQDIQVIILTNSNNIAELKDLYSLGAAGYIVKSFYPEEYFQKIKAAIEYWYNMALPSM